MVHCAPLKCIFKFLMIFFEKPQDKIAVIAQSNYSYRDEMLTIFITIPVLAHTI
jgi:hypothetical protein